MAGGMKPMLPPGIYNGMQVIIVPPIVGIKSWGERLLSWPWRPWVKVKCEPKLRDGETLIVGRHIYMNAATNYSLMQEVYDEKSREDS